MGKREIARYEQFLLFPQCFQKACFPGASIGVIVWEWVKCWANDGICHQIVGKNKNSHNVFFHRIIKTKNHTTKSTSLI